MGIFNNLKAKKDSVSLDIEIPIDVTLRGPKTDRSYNTVFVTQTRKTFEVGIPNRVKVGDKVVLRGLGIESDCGETGDLLLIISSIDYCDITINKNVKRADLTDKIEVYIPHLSKYVYVAIPDSLKNKCEFTLKLDGLGFPKSDNTLGDLFLCITTIDDNMEGNVSHKEEELLSWNKLQSLIGLSDIKKDVNNMVNLVAMQMRRKQQGMKSVPISMHCVFTGNPGTGKTTVARILADIYHDMGILSKGQLIEVDRSELVGQYIGETALKTQEKINQAIGGILFVDEAYTLVKEGNDFGQEAIDTLLKAMEDNRNDFIVIVAGYSDLMQKFINSNPGLKSRFNKYFYFPDYNADELVQIFCMLCDRYGYYLTPAAEKIMKMKIELIEVNKSRNFANAREIRNLFEQVVTNQASRLSNNESGDMSLLTEEDFFALNS